MSIALLFETQKEIRRLMIAGSDLAIEDFRLKKILPNMKKSGESVPVFARVADAMEKVIQSDGNSSEKILELANLVNAVLYTQGQTGIEGEIKDIENKDLVFNTEIPYRKLKPVVEALTTKGSGRLEIIREAKKEGLFNDLRLINPLISSLEDNYAEIADLVVDIISEYGGVIVPILKGGIDFAGGKSHARRIDIISKLKGSAEKELYLEAIDKGSLEIRIAAIKALKDLPECEALLLELSKERKKEIREASLSSLAYMDSSISVERLFAVLKSKERDIVFAPLRSSNSELITKRLLEEAEKAFEEVVKLKGVSLKDKANSSDEETVNYFAGILYCMEGKMDAGIFNFLKKCLNHTELFDKLQINYSFGYGQESTIAGMVGSNIFKFRTTEAFKLLDSINGKFGSSLVALSFESTLWSYEPDYVYDNYCGYLEKGKKNNSCKEILSVMNEYIDFQKPYSHENAYRYSYGRMSGVDKSGIQWDKRWIKNLIVFDEVHLVCKLATENLDICTDYLLKKLDVEISFSKYDVVEIVKGLMQAKYPNMLEVIGKVIDSNMDKKKRYYNYYFDEFIRVLGLLPAEFGEGIKELGKKYEGEIGEKLLEVGEKLCERQ